MRGKATPIGKRSWQRMRRTCPAACHRMECHRDRLTVLCTVLCFCGQVATSSARYGILCGWILVLLRLFPIHGTAAEFSSHAPGEDGAEEQPRHCRPDKSTTHHGTAEGGVGSFWDTDASEPSEAVLMAARYRHGLGGVLLGGSPKKKAAVATKQADDNETLMEKKALHVSNLMMSLACAQEVPAHIELCVESCVRERTPCIYGALR